MSTNPRLLWVVCAEVEKGDQRFDPSILDAMEEKGQYTWNTEIPVLLGAGPVWHDFDLVTRRFLDDLPSEILYRLTEFSAREHLLRGLFLVPGFNELFDEAGRAEIRQDANPLMFSYRDPAAKASLESAIAEHRFIEMYKPWKTDQWYSAAIHVLHHVGWTGIRRTDLRLMMVFDWA